MTPRRRLVLVLAGAAVLFAWNTWGHDLWAPDEPYFAEGAREMLVDGRWIVPHVNGVITTDKPPLFFWLIAGFSSLVGAVTPLTARLPSLLAALGTAWIVAAIARRDDPSGRTGVLAVVVFATATLVWRQARSAQIDSVLCFLETAALFSFLCFRRRELDGRVAGLLFWLACALAVLAKGPVGFLIPLGVVVTTLAWDRELPRLRRFAPLAGPALFLAVVGAWLVAAATWDGGAYSPVAAFREHVLERAAHGMHHAQPPWYYLEVLPVQALPWSGLVPAALWLAWRRRAEGSERFLLAWAAFVVVFFSIPVEKRDLYVLPAFPALALLVGKLGAGAWPAITASSREAAALVRSRWAWSPQALVGGAFLLAGVALPFLVADSYPQYATEGWLLAAVLAGGGAVILAGALTGRPRLGFVATASTAAALYAVAATFVLPSLDGLKSARPLAVQAARLTAEDRAAGGHVTAYRLTNLPDALSFYSDGMYVLETDEAEVAAARLRRPGEHVLLPASELDSLTSLLGQPPPVLLSHELARRTVLLLGAVPGQPSPGPSGAVDEVGGPPRAP